MVSGVPFRADCFGGPLRHIETETGKIGSVEDRRNYGPQARLRALMAFQASASIAAI